MTPGAFAPTCADHETLRDNQQVFNVRIQQGSQGVRLFDVFQNRVDGRTPSVVIAPAPNANICP